MAHDEIHFHGCLNLWKLWYIHKNRRILAQSETHVWAISWSNYFLCDLISLSHYCGQHCLSVKQKFYMKHLKLCDLKFMRELPDLFPIKVTPVCSNIRDNEDVFFEQSTYFFILIISWTWWWEADFVFPSGQPVTRTHVCSRWASKMTLDVPSASLGGTSEISFVMFEFSDFYQPNWIIHQQWVCVCMCVCLCTSQAEEQTFTYLKITPFLKRRCIRCECGSLRFAPKTARWREDTRWAALCNLCVCRPLCCCHQFLMGPLLSFH